MKKKPKKTRTSKALKSRSGQKAAHAEARRGSKITAALSPEARRFWRTSLAAGVPLGLIVREQRRIDSYIAAWKQTVLEIALRQQRQRGRSRRRSYGE